MESRRDFLKKAALLTGGAAMWGGMPESILRAISIDPEEGTTFLDAEHVVILMQENRSFDHALGSLQGVRGYRDPRPHVLPNGNPVWLQTNPAGQTFVPFRLDIKETNATWMGSLPHSWSNQVDARNEGRYDRWLQAKPSGYPGAHEMPLTLGHYTREDIPFYYALADAFTVCDYHFCSSLTGTTPNRLFLWTGTCREDAVSPARIRNEETDYGREAAWTTFPERLQKAGIAWRIYQNEISLDSGFQGEEDAWLSNFTDNPIEWFSQYRVRFSKSRRAHLAQRAESLPKEIADLEKADTSAENEKRLDRLRQELEEVRTERQIYSEEAWKGLSPEARDLHERAFATNEANPSYRELDVLTYEEASASRTVKVPKGDILHRFREDVRTGNLPTVSWLVAPENFSDHPGAAWYGAWYVSEVLDILTANPEVWKKTIFILTYDENDGYFDHIPPFVAPHPDRPETGKVSKGIETEVEYCRLEDDLKRKPSGEARGSAVGLGFRVPFVIASPWSRGGCVNSQVFDHTSVLRFLEVLLSHRTGRKIEEPNISAWRRTVCGDLTSAFRPYRTGKTTVPPFPDRDAFIKSIHRARFKGLPSGFRGLSADEIERARGDARGFVSQERGARPACPLPYDLAVEASLSPDRKSLRVRFSVGEGGFGGKAAGAPFNAYAYTAPGELSARSYAVSVGDALEDEWPLGAFADGQAHVRVDGPNGFFREFRIAPQAEAVRIETQLARGKDGKVANGKVLVRIVNESETALTASLRDRSYGHKERSESLAPGSRATFAVETGTSHGWYDFEVDCGSHRYRYAGHVETGEWSWTEPAMS